jgi:LDH2 family malate/lactate/ureidoglycolate dehydrogenase
MPATTVAAQTLQQFAEAVLAGKGMGPADARTVAEALVWADLRGVGTHGVARLPQYCGFIERGDLDPRAVPERTTELPAAVRIEARRAAGPVALRLAIELVAQKARDAAVGMAIVGETTHTGALGYYTQALARRSFAALALTATNPLMLYHGAAAAGVGTNPLSIAVPSGGDDPVLLDMSTGATSMGQVQQARRSGQPLPPGVAADEHGQPVTDPRLAQCVLPLAGAKGAGLSLMIELLASHLAGHPLVAEALERTAVGKTHRQNALLLAIDCSRFLPPAELAGMAERLARAVHGLAPVRADLPVRLPGERGDETARRQARSGVALPAPVVEELTALARTLALDPRQYWD